MSTTSLVAGSGGPLRSRVPLTRERIVAAALELADARGEFSMRALGQQLGVDPMAVYRHFDGKEALLDALVDAALADLAPMPAAAGSPVERLRQLCLDFRRALFAHPGVAPRLKASLPPVGPHVIALTEATLGLLLDAGVEPCRAPRAFGMLVQFVTATADDEAHALAEFGNEHAWRAAVRERYAALPADAYPGVLAMAEALDGRSFQVDFEDGLDLLLDGIVRRGADRSRADR